MLSPGKETQESDVQDYFTKAEWNCMAAIEKTRAINMLRNYKYILAQGMDVKPPDFILKYENRNKQRPKMIEVSKSEMIFMKSPDTNSSWEVNRGGASFSRYCEAVRDNLSSDDSNSMNKIVTRRSYSTNCDESCSDFCQYCYISKQLNFDQSANNSMSPGDYCRNDTSNQNGALPQSFNGLTYNYCQCGCQSIYKARCTSHNVQHISDIYCEECGQKFAKQKYLKSHLKRFSISSNSRPFKCLFCSHSFVHEKNRKFHERVHDSSKMIPCCYCPLNFPDLISATVHIEETHQDKIHVCNECGMSYSNSSHLMRHTREVHKPYYCHECYLCGHRYATAIALARHELHHCRVQPYKCKICLKTFSSKTHLKKHSNSRSVEKKYECSSCKVKFLAYKSLKRHEKVYNSNRPFKCMVCGHAYNSKPCLTRHMKVHDVERLYMSF